MITRVLAQATVTDLEQARAWYDRLFDRTPDAAPMPGLFEYHVGDSCGVQVFEEPDRAGRSTVVLFDDDLDAAAERLVAAGLATAGIGPITSGRALQLTDPDGNRVTIVGA